MEPFPRRLSVGLSVNLLLAAQGFAAPPGSLDLHVAPGKFAEHCLRLDAGEAIRWRFTASEPMDFNIHFHRGKAVLQPVRREAAERASGTFRAQAADDYCLMWSNRTAVAVRVKGGVERRP